jgi:transcriptional regulator with XRE-family HTH domain
MSSQNVNIITRKGVRTVTAFAERLRRLRRQHDLTQKNAASRLNVSASAWGMWESGKREPDIDTLHSLAELFGVSVDYLPGGLPGA